MKIALLILVLASVAVGGWIGYRATEVDPSSSSSEAQCFSGSWATSRSCSASTLHAGALERRSGQAGVRFRA